MIPDFRISGFMVYPDEIELSVSALVANPTSGTVIDNSSMTADENDDYLLTGSLVESSKATIAQISSEYYTVTLYAEDMTAVADYDSANTYTFSAAGTYYLVFSLEGENVWADGTTDDITFTNLHARDSGEGSRVPSLCFLQGRD